MPMYEYHCTKCGHISEEFRSVSNREPTESDCCSLCGGQLSLSMSAPAIVYGVGDVFNKTPQDFKDKLSQINKTNLGSMQL